MMLGISSFTYGWSVGVPPQLPEHPLTPIDLVNRAMHFGLHCVQIGDNMPLHKLSESQRQDLRALLAKNDLRLEVGARGLTERHLHEYIEVASYFNAPLLRFVIDGDGYEPASPTIIEIIRGALSLLKYAGVTLGIENHDRFRAAELSAILRSVGDSAVGICLDTVNSLGAGEDFDRVVDELAPFTVNLHIKDYRISRLPHKMGFSVSGTPAGQGMLDIPHLISRLRTYGRCESGILEQWVPPAETLEETIRQEERWAAESMQYLKALREFRPRGEVVM